MARRRCSSGRDARVEAVKSALRIVRRARGPGRRETHAREMGRSLTTWDFHTRDPRHGDEDPVGWGARHSDGSLLSSRKTRDWAIEGGAEAFLQRCAGLPQI